MNSYNKQYQKETELFGEPYPEFETFIKTIAVKGAKALDVGCGQGRDTLMLARHGYSVTGIDSSSTGIKQMLERAKDQGGNVEGVVADFHTYHFPQSDPYDLIVLDSILHFEKNDREKELRLLDQLLPCLSVGGHFVVFVHKSAKKETELNNWIKAQTPALRLIKSDYIDYIYEEKSTNFKSKFQMYMTVSQK